MSAVTTPGPTPGSPSAMANYDRLLDGQRRAREERERKAREALGQDATPEQIDSWIREAKSAQAAASKLANMARQQTKVARQATAKVSAAAQVGAAPAPPHAEAPPPPAPDQATRATLYDHPVFGQGVRPGAVASVEVWRCPSERPEHNGPGMSPGYLETLDFETFSKDAVRLRHGGGKYEARALDASGRVVSKASFGLPGRAKSFDPEGASPALSRATQGFQADPAGPGDSYYYWQQAQADELAALRAEVAELRGGKANGSQSIDDKISLMKAELEVRESEKQKDHQRLLEQIEAKAEASRAADEARAAREAADKKAAADAQSTLMTTIISGQNNLLSALLSKDKGGGHSDMAAMIGPMLTGMADMAKVSTTQMTGMFSLMRDLAAGDEKKTVADRCIDLAEKGVSGLWDKAGDGVMKAIVERLTKPREGEVPAGLGQGMAFQLPDGRLVPPQVCADFVQRYRARWNADPSVEVCTQALTGIMNELAMAQRTQQAALAAQGYAPQQFAQAPTPQAPPPNPQQVLQALHAQAQQVASGREKFVQDARVQAAQQASAAGRTPQEAQALAEQAAQAAHARVNQWFAAYQAQVAAMTGQAPAQPPPVQQAPAPQVPAAPPAAAPVPANGAAQRPPAPVAPVVQAVPQPTSPTMIVEQAVAAQPAPDVISVPWISRTFVLEMAGAMLGTFEHGGRHYGGGAPLHPYDFLRRSLEAGRLSGDAKNALARIYEDAAEDESLDSILKKVMNLLGSRGVDIPAVQLLSIMSDAKTKEKARTFVELFLNGCTYETLEEAERELAAEAKR